MPKLEVAVELERHLLDEVDELVAAHEYPNRSLAIEAALAESLNRRALTRLDRESALLDPAEEHALAEEGLGLEVPPADRTRFGLDADRWEAFLDALDAPPRDLPRLERLLREPSVFERGTSA